MMDYRRSGLALCLAGLTACASSPPGGYIDSPNAQPVPVRSDRNTLEQLAKSDIDRLADIEYAENSASLKRLMLKLYKRNPAEAMKSAMGTPEQIAELVFDPEVKHHWQFEALAGAQATAAIQLAFSETYHGDRVLALMVGIQSMLYKAHGLKTHFFITDSLEPQNLYNAARNIEIAMWKLSTAKADGHWLLLSNSVLDEERNLSFEREFSKVVARTDMLALVLAEKSQRLITRLTQSITTARFFPF